jgi:hypothetical protein
MNFKQLYQDIYQKFLEKKDAHQGYDFQHSPVGSATPPVPTFTEKVKWWTLNRPSRLQKIRKDRDQRQQDIVNLKEFEIPIPCRTIKTADLPFLMQGFFQATVRLYHQSLLATLHSFRQSWILIPVLLVFTLGLILVTSLIAPLGMVGGLILGAANALIIGATLSLTEQAIRGGRRLQWQDIPQSMGQYFWEVISVGFMVWFPLLFLEMGLQANPYQPLIATAMFFLMFVLLNPVPEVIYQSRKGSALEVVRESYEFVLENWIEWFLPVAIALAPFGLSFFFQISSQAGRRGGLDFWHLLTLPFSILSQWLSLLGMSDSISFIIVLIITPIATVFMLLFRGHLFAALHRSSRRQRMFQSRTL